ncbi:hypothetical protein Tco_0293438, partial [Tanacetum coccineum]
MLHQRMFESGLYKSLLEYVALYEALEASMERELRDEFLAKKDKSRKRQRDDQDPPPPPDLDLNKKKRHDSGASGSSQPPAPESSAWKTTDTREAPLSNSLDTDYAHLPKIKQSPEWLKPITEEDKLATPELYLSIPTNDLLEPE